MTSEHVLVFSIGPVQGLITASRRGRDLWFSSWLLSELARSAGRAARPHLVMPTADALDRSGPVSNKLLLHIVGEDPAAVAAEMSDAVRRRLTELAEATLRRVPDGLADQATAMAQVADLPELVWASADLRDGRPYAEARRLAEALAAARKSPRPFTQPTWAGPVPKSSLDAQRESVLRVDQRPGRRTPKQIAELQAIGVGAAERLCGVGLLKRLGHRAADGAPGGRVQSTSHVASWSLRRSFHERGPFQDDCRRAFEAYEARLRDLDADLSQTPAKVPVLGRCDGHILYESRLVDLFPPRVGTGADQKVATAGEALRTLHAAWRAAVLAHAVPLHPLTPYYAVLIADGDRMGEAIDGLHEVEDHRRATAALEAFATDAGTLVEEHHGHTVYAGGDDVLALLPVTTVLDAAEALRDRFRAVAEVFADLGAPTSPSLSVGIHVAHHVRPLQAALDGGRRAEHHAKQGLGRDAWALTVDKRGGAPVRTGGKWNTLGQLRAAVAALGQQGVSRGLPHELRTVADRLPGKDLAPVRTAELTRILVQKDLSRDLFAGMLDDSVDLARLADLLIAARALSGMEVDDDRA